MPPRAVTERDFRRPEFMDAKPEDYEFRGDGKIVRKDRWERAVQSIRSIVGINAREFEIEDVVGAVRALVDTQQDWLEIRSVEDCPAQEWKGSLRLKDGSVLNSATYANGNWLWRGLQLNASVAAWREHDESSSDA